MKCPEEQARMLQNFKLVPTNVFAFIDSCSDCKASAGSKLPQSRIIGKFTVFPGYPGAQG
jgi:hypothetical protein